MKTYLKRISLLLVITMLLPFTVTAYPNYVEQNPDVILPRSTPEIDAEIEDTGVWSPSAILDTSTVGYFWENRAMTTSGEMFFAYDDDYLYFAADISDSNSTNGFVYSTGYDNIDNIGTSRPYGFNGDVVVLMIDPSGIFEKSEYNKTAWYSIGLFANDTLKVYRSQANEGDITSSVRCAGKRTALGWRFEIGIPWDTIVSDAKKINSGASVTKAGLNAVGAVTRASVMYMDRYSNNGRTSTWGRFITVCDQTYDGYGGTQTNGYSPKSFGLILENSIPPEHIWGKWETVTEGTCTEGAVLRRVCSDCGQVETKTTEPKGHIYGGWTVTREATSDTEGSKYHTCSVCGFSETRGIPAYGENKPFVVAYFNASQRYVSEFTHIDVLNYHPASVDKSCGHENAITHNYTRYLSSVKAEARAQNPDIKFVFTVASNNISDFESWLGREDNTDELARQIVEIVGENDFDGVDIDYEFPRTPMRRNPLFVRLIAQIRAGLDELAAENGKEYIVSIAVPGTTWAFSLFDIESLSEYVDYFNLMNYDLFINSEYTHHHASPYDNGLNGITGGSVYSDIQLYLEKGIPASKIVVGCGMYAHTWTGVTGGGEGGLYGKGTMNDSNIHYTDLLAGYINRGGFTRYWDDDAKAPYLFNSRTKTFISYDDEESVGYKCDLVNEFDVRGLMIFDYCTCDGIGFFDKVYDMLTTSPDHVHEFVEDSRIEPLCEEIGQRTDRCTLCGETYRYIIPAAGHKYTNEPGYDPTCTEEGATRLAYCVKCGKVLTAREPIPALGHDFGEWQYLSETKNIRYCARCGESETCYTKDNYGYGFINDDITEIYWIEDALEMFESGQTDSLTIFETGELVTDLDMTASQSLTLYRNSHCYSEITAEKGAKVFMALGSVWGDKEPGHIYVFDGDGWVTCDGPRTELRGATILQADDPLALDKQSLKFGLYIYDSDTAPYVTGYGVIYIPEAVTALDKDSITLDTPLASVSYREGAPVIAPGSDHAVVTASLNEIPQARYGAEIYARAYYTLMIGDTEVTFYGEGVSRSVRGVWESIADQRIGGLADQLDTDNRSFGILYDR